MVPEEARHHPVHRRQCLAAWSGRLWRLPLPLKRGCGRWPRRWPRNTVLDGIHVGHVVVDGAVDGDKIHSRFPDANSRPDRLLDIAGIVECYAFLYRQHRTAWSFEIDVRTFAGWEFRGSRMIFSQAQTCSALKKPPTTLGTVNFDYIHEHDPAFHLPGACALIRNAPWRT